MLASSQLTFNVFLYYSDGRAVYLLLISKLCCISNQIETDISVWLTFLEMLYRSK